MMCLYDYLLLLSCFNCRTNEVNQHYLEYTNNSLSVHIALFGVHANMTLVLYISLGVHIALSGVNANLIFVLCT